MFRFIFSRQILLADFVPGYRFDTLVNLSGVMFSADLVQHVSMRCKGIRQE